MNRKCVLLPDIVLFAVHLTVPLEAGDLVFQLYTTLGALEAGGVPLRVHGAQVVLVHDPETASGAQGRRNGPGSGQVPG